MPVERYLLRLAVAVAVGWLLLLVIADISRGAG
jgi:hypothetical protein